MSQPNMHCSIVKSDTRLIGISLIVNKNSEDILFCDSFLLNLKDVSRNQINVTVDNTVNSEKIILVNYKGLAVAYIIKKDMALLLNSFINPDTKNVPEYVLGTIDHSDKYGYMITSTEIKDLNTIKLFPLLQIPITEL